ncbi:MAG: DUF3048 domain-containing protein [Oscillospiraceae bacterium]|nr:DUF3048 domain-containing protein [Oscillospiraceae bacterium]
MKKAIFAAALLAGVLMLAGCGNQSAPETTPAETSSVVETTPVSHENTNNLTGLDTLSKEAIGKRPVAVMINNISQSLPQYGIADADLMFETLVEGGITRMMAVYGDYTKIPDICSVRSCRYYYPILAEGLDAVYIHCGCDPTIAAQTLKSLGIDHFEGNDGNELLFERDQQRLQTYAVEHTMKLKGANVPKAMEEAHMRSDLKEDKNEPILHFREEGKIVAPDDGNSPCTTVDFRFSDDAAEPYFSTFTYDAAKKVYLKQHNGNPHMDAAADTQLSYTNVFVLETDLSVRDAKGRMNVDWTGGTGYYVSAGACQKIKWSKPTEEDTIRITDENGKDITVNAGKSYFGIIQTGNAKLSAK